MVLVKWLISDFTSERMQRFDSTLRIAFDKFLTCEKSDIPSLYVMQF